MVLKTKILKYLLNFFFDHRSEFKNESELNTLLLKYEVKASFYQPQLIW